MHAQLAESVVELRKKLADAATHTDSLLQEKEQLDQQIEKTIEHNEKHKQGKVNMITQKHNKYHICLLRLGISDS